MTDLDRESRVARQIRALFSEGAAGLQPDRVLLERFATRGGDAAEAAFAALVERHGPMVLRACLAILGDSHRAQDAFQATFFLLARRAGTLWVRDSVGPWLHSVAGRVAKGLRAADGRCRALEGRAADRARRATEDSPRDELSPALHEEIERLPERLRAPLVLCYLEGLTHEQAAEHLACPVGTVRSRLSRGRERLRRGLTRRGFAAPSSGDEAPPAALPAALASSASVAALLARDRYPAGWVSRWLSPSLEGWFKTMMHHPLRTALVLLIVPGAVAVGLGLTRAQEPGKPAASASDQDRRIVELNEEVRLLNQRIGRLESRLSMPRAGEADGGPRLASPVLPDPARRADPRDTPTYRVRTRFPALVEAVFVRPGQIVNRGDPLLTLHGPDLAQAANDCRVKFVQWDHDRRLVASRKPLARDKSISEIAWVDTQNAERKSRVEYAIARDKLAVLGMGHEQIDAILADFEDEPKADRRGDVTGGIVRLTITAPFDATVQECLVETNDWTEPKNVLMVLFAR